MMLQQETGSCRGRLGLEDVAVIGVLWVGPDGALRPSAAATAFSTLLIVPIVRPIA